MRYNIMDTYVCGLTNAVSKILQLNQIVTRYNLTSFWNIRWNTDVIMWSLQFCYFMQEPGNKNWYKNMKM